MRFCSNVPVEPNVLAPNTACELFSPGWTHGGFEQSPSLLPSETPLPGPPPELPPPLLDGGVCVGVAVGATVGVGVGVIHVSSLSSSSEVLGLIPSESSLSSHVGVGVGVMDGEGVSVGATVGVGVTEGYGVTDGVGVIQLSSPYDSQF